MRKKSPETARRILDGAQALILENGLKATTMEAIAARARMAKGTLYAYFPDKNAVFAALIEDLAQGRADAFAQGFIGGGELAARSGRGLAAMFGLVAERLERSPFAHELIGEHNRLASHFDAADTAIGEEIIAAMKVAGIADAEKIVPVLMAACWGLVMKAPSPKDVREGIVLLCDRVVR